MRRMKKGWENVVSIGVMISLIASYIIFSYIHKIVSDADMSISDAIFNPIGIYGTLTSDANLLTISVFIPFLVTAIVLYLLRKNIFDDEYDDASEFGLHGTAKWGNPNDLRDGKVLSKDKKSCFKKDLKYNLSEIENGYILGKVPNTNKLLVMHDETSIDNQNVVVIGSSGSSKTQSYVLPNIINVKNKSIIVTDPKGELYDMTHQLKIDQGYKVYQVDFVQFMQSKYNPLTYVETPLQAQKVANTIISNFEGEGGGDNVFFKNQATNMLSALIIYVKSEYPPEEANMEKVIDVYTKYVQNEETFSEWIETVPENHPARDMLNAILDLTGNTRGSVTSTLNNGFSIFKLPQVQNMTSTSDFHFSDFVEEKAILYVKLSMEDDTFSPLTSVFFSQMINIYYDIAEQSENNKLKRKVVFLLDEFANIGKIDKYSKVLATCRSLGLSMHTIIQNKAQLEKKSMYGKEETRDILGNHDTIILLRAKKEDTDTTKWFSDALGQTTKKLKKESVQTSKSGTSHSTNFDYVERPLMTPEEVGSLKRNESLVIISGHDPLFLHKAFQFEIYPDMLTKEVDGEFVLNYNNVRKDLGYKSPVHKPQEFNVQKEMTFSEYRKLKEKSQRRGEKSDVDFIDNIEEKSGITEDDIQEVKKVKKEIGTKDLNVEIDEYTIEELEREHQERVDELEELESLDSLLESEEQDTDDLLKSVSSL